MPSIYLAGKITGDKDYKAKFEKAAAFLEGLGFEVRNPAELPQGQAPAYYMKACLPLLLDADCATFLPDWIESPGARIERQLARYCGIPVLEWDEACTAAAETEAPHG